MKLGTRETWLAARVGLLAEDDELSRRSDELARRRQALSWAAVEEGRQGLQLDFAVSTEEGGGAAQAFNFGTTKYAPGRGGDPEGWPRRHDEYERARGTS